MRPRPRPDEREISSTPARRGVDRRRIALGLALLLAWPGPAMAYKPRLQLQGVDASECRAGEVHVYASETELEGTVRSRPPSSYRLLLDGKPIAGGPIRSAAFAESHRALRVSLVIQASSSVQADLAQIKEGATALVRELPARGRFTVIAYAGGVDRLTNLASAETAIDAIETLEASEVAGEHALVEALREGLRAVSAKGDARRLLVVVSDGLNRLPKRELFRSLGDQAAALGIGIFPIGYSPIDERGPLLNLGEVAKRSRGTFRWARRAAAIKEQFVNLGREVSRQLILTFSLPTPCQGRHSVQIEGGMLRSNAVTFDLPAQGATPARRSWALWLLVSGGIVALGLLFVIVAWRRAPARAR